MNLTVKIRTKQKPLKAIRLKGFQHFFLINIVPCIGRVPMGVLECGTYPIQFP